MNLKDKIRNTIYIGLAAIIFANPLACNNIVYREYNEINKAQKGIPLNKFPKNKRYNSKDTFFQEHGLNPDDFQLVQTPFYTDDQIIPSNVVAIADYKGGRYEYLNGKQILNYPEGYLVIPK